jgi:Pyruvate/2-oxoglutarate dehydrogenase complex, dihydrolipoamide acyltransferase (E2) component, and related enzymes
VRPVVQIGPWKKQEGDSVKLDETVVEIESDKATVELPAPSAGVIVRILKAAGEQATVGEVIGLMEEGASGASEAAAEPVVDVRRSETRTVIGSVQPASTPPVANPPQPSASQRVMPAAARVLGEAGVPAEGVAGTGPGGRVTKQDAISATVAQQSVPAATPPTAPTPTVAVPTPAGNREERPVLMSPIRGGIPTACETPQGGLLKLF